MISIFKHRYNNWSEIEKVISELPTPKEKGDAFEIFAHSFFQIFSKVYNAKSVYMQKDIPLEIKKKYRLEIKDNGVDGIIITNDDKIIAYQVKFRSDNSYADYSELATFWAESEYCDSRCIFSNSYSLPRQSEKKKNQFTILVDSLLDLKDAFFDSLYQLQNTGSIANREKFDPKTHQIEIIDNVVKGFLTNDRGKIISACGTGKTLTSLWIKEKLKADTTLFIVPSLALIKQTLNQWLDQRLDNFAFLCVCSDHTITDDIEDEIIIEKTSYLPFPVTTDSDEIIQFLILEGPKVLFSTYHSMDSIMNALNNIPDFEFDLAIFDEAHRTAGSRDSSMFTLAMEDKYIPIKKRLFMTATERVVSPRFKKILENTEYEIFSMDDPIKYGPTFASLSFGKAIEQGIISDYRILLSVVTEEELSGLLKENYYVSVDDQINISALNDLLKQVILSRAISEFNIKKVISYHRSVDAAKSFINGDRRHIPFKTVFDSFFDSNDYSTFFSHVNGTMNSTTRSLIFNQFTKSNIAIMTNAKCLTEGVDLPVIDAVMFVDPKRSIVDIIQAIGRALRLSPIKQNDFAYIILPIVLPKGTTSFSEIEQDSFDTLHNVLQALRDQDERLSDEIDALNLRVATKGKKSVGTLLTGLEIAVPQMMDLTEFKNGLELRIAEINKNPENIAPHYVLTEGPKGRASGIKRVFRTIGDYNANAYGASTVLPTLQIYAKNKLHILPSKTIAFNHNNVSHTVKVGAITKIGDSYSLTDIGRTLLANPEYFSDIFKKQLLKYYDFSSEKNIVIFPYRAFFKIMLFFDHITKVEFLYSLYSLQGTTEPFILEAIDRINEIRNTYPNIEILNEDNKNKVLQLLNVKYSTDFKFADVWTTRTTASNQFNYFKNHVLLFTDIFSSNESSKIEKKENADEIIYKELAENELIETLSVDDMELEYKKCPISFPK